MGWGGTLVSAPYVEKTCCSGKATEALFQFEIHRPVGLRAQTQISSPPVENCGRMASLELVALGVCMSYRKACLILLLVVIPFTAAPAQVAHPEQVQIAPPLIRAIEPPAPDATAAALEEQ